MRDPAPSLFSSLDLRYDDVGAMREGKAHADAERAYAAAQAALRFVDGRGGATYEAAGDAPLPPAKLALGLPAYARGGRGGGEVRTYAEIVEDHADGGGSSALATDADASAAADGGGAWRFDSVATARAKAAWARAHGLAGVMLWEAGQDSPRASHSLLVALADESARDIDRTAGSGAEL